MPTPKYPRKPRLSGNPVGEEFVTKNVGEKNNRREKPGSHPTRPESTFRGHANETYPTKPAKGGKTEAKPARKKPVSQLEVKQEGQLMEFLISSLKDQSRTTIKSLLSHQQVTIENRVVKKFDHPLKPGDVVCVHWESGKTTLDNPMLSIVFEDKDLIVVNKSAGLLSIATKKERVRTAYSLLSEYVKKQHPANKVFVVHRLDRETSGLMLFAKNEEVQYRMQNNWKFAVNQRKYIAVVEGKLETGDGTGKGTIRSYLWESKALIVYSSPNPEDGQVAVTHYQVLKSNDDYSLVECELETGRKNQIRVQMNSIGFPLVGDLKYGGHTSPLKRLALHAHVLSFIHPVTGEMHAFETPIPPAFQKLVGGRPKEPAKNEGH